jgi:hypothetical protein
MHNEDRGLSHAAEKQVGAIIAKTMEALEGLDCLRHLHPMEFYTIRKLVIKAFWGAYTVGMNFGRRIGSDAVHRDQH